ncbi:uncharacterized protein BJX67DRAFT_327305 [Aspergillus lucknowensis]|uniref:Uncharacterized protein n=1 Tax=Aspergillus lucknowensis TaxID=176173 RepID=A0ABR4LBD8_9EURO
MQLRPRTGQTTQPAQQAQPSASTKRTKTPRTQAQQSGETQEPSNQPLKVGHPMPNYLLHIQLPVQSEDGTKRKTTLQQLLNRSVEGIVVCVYSHISKKVLESEFERLSGGPALRLKVAWVGLSTYPPSVHAALLGESEFQKGEKPYRMLSDPATKLLQPMGFVRPRPRSKTWSTRMRKLGSIRCGFFIITKDKRLFARKMGKLDNIVEELLTAQIRLYAQPINGGVKRPW